MTKLFSRKSSKTTSSETSSIPHTQCAHCAERSASPSTPSSSKSAREWADEDEEALRIRGGCGVSSSLSADGTIKAHESLIFTVPQNIRLYRHGRSIGTIDVFLLLSRVSTLQRGEMKASVCREIMYDDEGRDLYTLERLIIRCHRGFLWGRS